jgi:hypothetical protein
LAARSLIQFHSDNATAFAVLLVLAVVGSALKIRFPGIEMNISINFLPVLLAAVILSPAEAMLVAAAAGAVQCKARARKQPSLLQIGFNAANLGISAWVASSITGLLTAPWMPQIATVAAAIAACIYYICNAVLLCGFMCTLERKPFSAVWSRTYWLSLPYYIAGAALVFAAADVALRVDWRPAMLILPVILLGHKYYSRWVLETSRVNS